MTCAYSTQIFEIQASKINGELFCTKSIELNEKEIDLITHRKWSDELAQKMYTHLNNEGQKYLFKTPPQLVVDAKIFINGVAVVPIMEDIVDDDYDPYYDREYDRLNHPY